MKLLVLILVAFISWTGYTSYHQWLNIKEKKLIFKELKEKEEEVLTTQKELEKKVLLLKNNEYIAEMARKYYFLSKPGEIIIISPEG